MRPTAGNAALRPAQKATRSSSLVEARSVVQPRPLAISATRSIEVVHLGFRPVQLDDQQRPDIERIADLDEGFRRLDGQLVHHLHAAGNDAGADDAGDAFARGLGGREADQHRARGLRLLEDAHRHLGDDAEQPFRADNEAEQIEPAGIEMLAAETDHLAGDQHHLDAHHIIGGEAVFQAVHAAGILRDIAANGAGDLRGRVGRVIEAVIGDRRGDAEIGDAGLRGHRAVVEIDVEDAVELAHAEQDRILQRQRAAGERGAGAARHHADAVLRGNRRAPSRPGRCRRAAPRRAAIACRR